MNLLETNPHINIASDHSVSSNNSFKSFLNAESFNMVLTLLQLCEAPWFCFRVCCKADVNVWGWCEFSFRRKLIKKFYFLVYIFEYIEAVVRRSSVKKVFLEISLNSQENSCGRVSFLIKLQTWGPQLY